MTLSTSNLNHYTVREYYPHYSSLYGKKYGHTAGTDHNTDYMQIVKRAEIEYWEEDKTKNQNTACVRALGLERKCKVSFED